MSGTTTARVCVRALTVTDWDGIGWDRLVPVLAELDRLGAFPVVVYDAPVMTARRRDGSVPPVAVVTFDGERVRDTWAHGWTCDAGYVCSIQW